MWKVGPVTRLGVRRKRTRIWSRMLNVMGYRDSLGERRRRMFEHFIEKWCKDVDWIYRAGGVNHWRAVVGTLTAIKLDISWLTNGMLSSRDIPCLLQGNRFAIHEFCASCKDVCSRFLCPLRCLLFAR